MKVTTILIFAFLMQVSAAGLAQKITLNERNASLESVMDKIRSQTGYEFVFNVKDIDNAKRVNVSFTAKELNEALEELFEDQALSFSVKDKFIVVKPKEKSFIDKLVGILDNNRRTDIDVKGKVINENNETLPGSLIKVKGTNRAVIADAKGNFELYKVDDKAILLISYIGYEAQEVKAAPSMGYITLKPTTNALDQVVIQGYGTTTQRLNTGNIATVTAKEIEKQPVMNVLQALQGKVPGLVVTQTSGYASAPFKVELRGRSVIDPSLPSEPLYIIDGVPWITLNVGGRSTYESGSAGNLQTGFIGPAKGQSPLFSINPNDIESITVLKDADATAIYGSRGGNGVIIINTKRGISGKTKFTASANTGLSFITRFYDLLNTQEYLAMRREAFKNDGIKPTPTNAFDLLVWDTTRYTNWQKEFWGKAANRSELQTSLSGGDSQTTFRIGAGYTRLKSLNNFTGSDQRKSAQFNIQHSGLSQKFKVSLSGFYTNATIDMISLGGSVLLPPNAPPIFNEFGKLNFKEWEPSRLFTFGTLLQPYQADTRDLNAQMKIQYNILKGLTFATNLGYSSSTTSQENKVPQNSMDPRFVSESQLTVGSNASIRNIIEPELNYKTLFAKGELDFILGGTYQYAEYRGQSIVGRGFPDDSLLGSIGSAKNTLASDSYGQYKYAAGFLRLKYNLYNKYLFSFSGRRDGSSKFGSRRQYGNFGSLGAAWIFSDEPFFNVLKPILSHGKLRLSYGHTGSDIIGDYKYLTRWTAQNMIPYLNTSGYTALQHANPDLQWQVDKKFEVGFDFAILNDKHQISIVWYQNRIGNQLVTFNLPQITGFGDVTANLPAVIQNRGLELTANSALISTKEFSWNANFNIGMNSNILLSFPNIEQSPYAFSYQVGKSLGTKRLLVYTGVDPTTGLDSYLDYNGDGEIVNAPGGYSGEGNDDFGAESDLSVRFDGGIGTNFRYKGLNLSLDFHFRKQNGKSALFNTLTPGALSNQPLQVKDHWQKPGDNALFPKYSTFTPLSYRNRNLTDRTYIDASFIRLNNVTLSYDLPIQFIKKIGVKGSKIYLRSQNLFVISKYDGIDPEAQQIGSPPPPSAAILGMEFNF